ncbi:hypothetical protein Q5H92_08095 [Hymenobacter sp. M29]|uniref:Lipoprotein n=1 Tax=Hymenobacter mellowenesis TaxID=3063995 RepID=A0ABT9A8Z1_9BACT|nr:hypothetical protein [Hymenobacter sp. M29]MDO7846312.1 hypothetical protein [Hymenobacter sp. M29]
MKRTFYPILLAGLLTACQHPSEKVVVTSEPAAVLPTTVVSKATRPPVVVCDSAVSSAMPDSMAPAMRAFARQHDLSGVWQGLDEADSAGLQSPTVCDGFFGPDHYRIELVLQKITRDAADPLLYHVQGKDKYKRQVTPFTGTIRLRQLRSVPIKSFEYELQGEFARFYTALGEFSWREMGSKSAGVFKGQIGVDFQQKADSSLIATYFMGDDKRQFAKGWRMHFDGEWTSSLTGQRKQLLASANIEGIGSTVFSDFNVGERSFSINPKYAKLGWNELWENDEWWADSPKPSLSL